MEVMQHIRKIKAIIILFIMSFLMTDIAYAQIGNLFESVKSIKESIKSKKEKKKEKKADEKDSNAVTLIVSADAKTKDEATKIALRSAIEQAYGTFVSANTTILNDELAKDEIVTISSGNIKEYKEIASEQMPNGNMYVTLQATVSISKLVSYAQSKGAETEFAGSTFGMNMKMKELNKKNEEIAFDNLAKQVISLYPLAFSYKLEISEPKVINDNTVYFNKDKYTVELPNSLSDIGLSGTYNDYYISLVTVYAEPNQQMNKIATLINSVMGALTLSTEEKQEYEDLNLKYFPYLYISTRANMLDNMSDYMRIMYAFRSDYSHIFSKINIGIAKILSAFKIVDNLGNISEITSWKYYDYRRLLAKTGTNLFSACCLQGNQYGYFNFTSDGIIDNPSETQVVFRTFILLPKNEISKYSNFKIEPKPVDSIVFEDPNGKLNFD